MSTATMSAIRVHDYGGPETLVLEQAPRPQPRPDQVLVRLVAAGVNPADWKMRGGAYKAFMPLKFPWTPGLEGAGFVDAVGASVTAFQPGQAVFGTFSAAYAEYAVTGTADLRLKPVHLTFEQAAAVPVGALTAWGVVEAAEVKPGQQVLVQGAAGGVGMFIVQFAHLKGAHVYGTASAGNADFVRSLGAERVIDYGAARFETVVQDMDAVLDTVGGDITERSWPVLRKGGVLVSVAGRPTAETAAAQGVRTAAAGRAAPDKLNQIAELLGAKTITASVSAVFPLAEARQAQELGQAGHGRGRIILLTA